jgi:protoporphyrinogen oxidase
MKVIIVGGGIGGLTAALMLHARGPQDREGSVACAAKAGRGH